MQQKWKDLFAEECQHHILNLRLKKEEESSAPTVHSGVLVLYVF